MGATTNSPLWLIILLALITSGVGAAIINQILGLPKTRRDARLATTEGDVAVANVFREDNVQLRGELRQVWEMMRKQADQIADLREKVSQMEDTNKDYQEQLETAQGKIITLEGEVSRLSKENELLRDKG